VPAHLLYEKVLDWFCAQSSLDPRALREMMLGNRPADPFTVDTMYRLLGVPKSAWSRRTKSTALVPLNGSAQDGAMLAAARVAMKSPTGGRRRRHHTAVHDVLDRLGWNVGTLADLVGPKVGRNISRPSMQFWATGQRQITHRGNGQPRLKLETAPQDVREAAEKLTAAEARKKHIGEEGILRASAWPNVKSPSGV
jgi:hypothetical protein